MSDNGYSATDIITFIGVPLAVLGVLPILYNTFVTLVNVSRIKRMLHHSQLTALTRSDVVNRVIEIELPRYAITPWDRFRDRHEYWTLARNPSSIPGGTWTTFNWRTNTIGLKTLRVEYADQLRQPQVEAAFDELVCYLLDLGAVPDPHGWKLLRATGLWTPVGCALMMSPDGREKALTVAPLDDSDGNLSLAVSWSSHWTCRDHSHLPPYWVKLAAPAPLESTPEKTVESSDSISEGAPLGERGEASSLRKESLDSARQDGESASKRDITCQISADGIVAALTRDEQPQSPDSLYVDHIRVRMGKSDGVWFASAVTAYGMTSQTILWNYRIPDDILSFARRDTVPCGVLELLGVVGDSDTPEWATRHDDDPGAALDLFVQRNREQRAAVEAEQRLPPALREQTVRDRVRREAEQRMQDMRDKMRLDNQRREMRMMGALQSPRWGVTVVAEHQLAWLKANGHVAEAHGLKDAVGALLHRMVLDGAFASSVCRMLDLWRAWADIGGMKRADYHAVQDGAVVFAKATLLVAMIKDKTTALEGTLSTDLQECLRMWRKVRLG